MLTSEEEAFIDAIELGIDMGDNSIPEEDIERYKALIRKRNA